MNLNILKNYNCVIQILNFFLFLLIARVIITDRRHAHHFCINFQVGWLYGYKEDDNLRFHAPLFCFVVKWTWKFPSDVDFMSRSNLGYLSIIFSGDHTSLSNFCSPRNSLPLMAVHLFNILKARKQEKLY